MVAAARSEASEARLPPTRSAAGAKSTRPQPSHASGHPALEFEPNRPDFKAGEYGENGADYEGADAPGPGTSSSPTPRSPAAGSPRAGELLARVSPPPSTRARSKRSLAAAARPARLAILLAITCLAN
ncbi:unnamed protein product [Chrysodeixis includens]|uniref:Uncharacterized protein n=1 Tax=Chrysodeixis includens TaxID=689277 RepID=A0A9N8PZ93_CHRIL|nr:unnamed protein product [Chrysodeixis includens]